MQSEFHSKERNLRGFCDFSLIFFIEESKHLSFYIFCLDSFIKIFIQKLKNRGQIWSSEENFERIEKNYFEIG